MNDVKTLSRGTVQNVPSDHDAELTLLRALAEPVRLSVVRQLARRPAGMCACDFAECCVVSQPTVSHHLKVLREAGVVTATRQGTNIRYQLRADFAARWAALSASLAG